MAGAPPRATFSAAAARPPQQSSRRVLGGDCNLRPAPLPLLPAGGRVASQSHSIMPGKLERIVFHEASAAIFVKTSTRSTKKYGTKGRGGIAKISLWREIIVMIEAKWLTVSVALDLLDTLRNLELL
jgi:hypothetical protein